MSTDRALGLLNVTKLSCQDTSSKPVTDIYIQYSIDYSKDIFDIESYEKVEEEDAFPSTNEVTEDIFILHDQRVTPNESKDTSSNVHIHITIILLFLLLILYFIYPESMDDLTDEKVKKTRRSKRKGP